MSQEDRLSRRSYLKFAGAATATVGIAGCTGGDGGDTPTDTPEPSSPTEAPTTEPPATEPPETATETPEPVREAAVRFTLRDASFHSGDPLTAEDVKYSIRRIVFDNVDFASPQNTDLGAVSVVEASDGEVTSYFSGLNPIAFQLFATNGEIMQKSWVQENSTDFINRNVNGTGPFQLTSYDSGNEVVYERYDDYWGGAAEVGGVTLNASTESSTRVNRLLAGESDIVTNVPPQEVSRVQDSGNAGIEAVPSTRIIFLFMRDNVEPFSSQKFRQAMNYAVDVQSIIDNILSGFGKVTSQPTLSEFVGHDPTVDPYPYDPDMAEQLVEESGHAGVEITLQTPIGRYLADVEIAQAAADQINQLSNVTCDVEQRDFSAYVQDLLVPIDEMEPEFGLLGWGNGEFDASQTIIPLLTSGSILTTYEDPDIDRLMKQAGNVADPDARVAILREANRKLNKRAPWVFMHQQFSVYGVSDQIDWSARADEVIDPYRASTTESDVQVGVTMGNMDSGLDPQDHAETNTDIVVSQGYEGLLDRDPEGGIIEGLATDWERVDVN